MARVDDIAGIRRILGQSRTIAVVGLSANWYRPSYFAAKYMQDHGYRIVPVNPTYTEVLGENATPACATFHTRWTWSTVFARQKRWCRSRAMPLPSAQKCCGCSWAS